MNADPFQQILASQIGRGHVYSIVVGMQSRDGRLDLVGAAGKADAAGAQEMTPDTPYFLASVTKMYTAATVVKLAEQGRLDLDAPLSAYLPASLLDGLHVYRGRDYSGQIQVYQLVNQTSGLADYETDRPEGGQSVLERLKAGQDLYLTLEQTLDLTRRLPPKFEPGAGGGTRAHYSNTNYRLLGAIIEAVTGQSVAQNFETLIFAPLGLRHTYVFDAAAAQSRPAPAALYLKNRPLNVPQYLSSGVADGGLVSTVRESLAFLRAFFEGRLFDARQLDRMTRRWNRIFFPLEYGGGLMRFKLPRLFSPFRPLPAFIGHSGSSGSFAYYCPDKALYLAGTINQIAAPGRPFRLVARLATA